MKRVLILGASILQSFIIAEVKRLGFYAIAFDSDPNCVGRPMADEFHCIDISNVEAVYLASKNLKIDAIICGATDYGILAAATTSKRLRLPGIDPKLVLNMRDKGFVRRCLVENCVDDINFYSVVTSETVISDLRINEIHFPVIVKPSDGSGSRGVRRVDDHSQLITAIESAKLESRSAKVLIESFIEGEEIGVEAIVCDGKPHILLLTQKLMTKSPCYAELGHVSIENHPFKKRITEVCIDAITSLGLLNSAVNMDLKVSSLGKVALIDISPRMGGNLICSHIVPNSIGFNYIGACLELSLGAKLVMPEYIELNSFVSTRIIAVEESTNIIDFNSFKFDSLTDGQVIFSRKQIHGTRRYCINRDGLGYVVAISEDKHKAIAKSELLYLDVVHKLGLRALT